MKENEFDGPIIPQGSSKRKRKHGVACTGVRGGFVAECFHHTITPPHTQMSLSSHLTTPGNREFVEVGKWS